MVSQEQTDVLSSVNIKFQRVIIMATINLLIILPQQELIDLKLRLSFSLNFTGIKSQNH